jgi:nucleoside-diphosphate kinase
MTLHPKKERTLVIIKPDGVQRSLIGEVIGRFEKVGLKIIGMKMMIASDELIEQHYTLDPEWRRITGEKNIKAYEEKGMIHPLKGEPLKVTDIILSKLKKYLTSGPIIAFVLEGAHSVAIVRKIVGSTEPLVSDVGTIRGDFVLDSYKLADDANRAVRNVVHASSSVKEAENEIKHWFKDIEIFDYIHMNERILYDVNMDGKKE